MGAPEVVFKDGWYEEEDDGFYRFRWMRSRASLVLPPRPREGRFLWLHIFSEYVNHSQVLSLALGGRRVAELPLLQQWSPYSVDLGPSVEPVEPSQGQEFILELNKVFPRKYHPDDDRELGVRVGPMSFHGDAAGHERFLLFLDNARRNFREMKERRTVLSSHPLTLGIDLYGKCNISPPCVYCLWDKMKDMEGGQTDLVVDDRTLEGYGPFFTSSRNLINCSFGEPLLHPRLAEILELCEREGKFVELSTNGQAFTPRTIGALVGKAVKLYVSLDAATAETYAKIRNDRWDGIVPNLERLNRERKKANGFPKIFMVFMPMKVNRDDLEEYFRLCRRIEADALVLRPLIYIHKPKIRKDRGGYHFDYKNEYLSDEEFRDIAARAEEYSRRYGVVVVSQTSFGTTAPPSGGG